MRVEPSQFIEHRNKHCPREVSFGKRSDGASPMSKLDLTEQHARERAGFAAQVPIPIFRDDTRDHADTQRMTRDALFMAVPSVGAPIWGTP
jgi:hypothetical protein